MVHAMRPAMRHELMTLIDRVDDFIKLGCSIAQKLCISALISTNVRSEGGGGGKDQRSSYEIIGCDNRGTDTRSIDTGVGEGDGCFCHRGRFLEAFLSRRQRQCQRITCFAVGFPSPTVATLSVTFAFPTFTAAAPLTDDNLRLAAPTIVVAIIAMQHWPSCGDSEGGDDSNRKDRNMAMKEAAEKNSSATAALADGGRDAEPPTSAAAAGNVISNANAVAARLDRLDNASRQFDPEEVIDSARAVSGLKYVIGGASTLLMRKVTRAGNARAIFVLGDVMVDTSAANVLWDVINDAVSCQ